MTLGELIGRTPGGEFLEQLRQIAREIGTDAPVVDHWLNSPNACGDMDFAFTDGKAVFLTRPLCNRPGYRNSGNLKPAF
jgi:hypothetical protein